MRDIAQTSAGTEYNSLSFQQLSLCIGRIKHLWCSQTFNPSRKALLYSKVGTTESRIPTTWQISRFAWKQLNVMFKFQKEKKKQKEKTKNYEKGKKPNDDWGRVGDCWQQWWDKQKITWNPSICRNASILALRREKQAKLRLGLSQHGEKSLKFHSINSIVEYAKRTFFLKQKYVNPLLSSSRDSTVFVHVAIHS